MSGLTSTGFTPKTYEEIKTELEDACKSVFGATINLAPSSVFGQLIGIMAERFAEVWEAAEEVYASFDPDAATAEALDSLCALTGTIRAAATHSTVTLTLTGTNGTTIPEGSQVSITATGSRFETLADATISGTTITVAAQAVDTGPIAATSGTSWTIETPVDGWTSVTNALDAEVGTDGETDTDLRERREIELRQGAGGALEAIRARLLEVDDVDGAIVFENATDTTDGDGIPPHAIECVVHGGTDADIAEAIFGTADDPRGVAAGIATHGDESATVTDSEGIAHTVSFSRATELPVYVIVNVDVDADEYPADGDDQITAALTTYGATYPMGKDVTASALSARVFSVSGVLDAEVLIGLTNPPTTSTTIAVGLRELATFDSSRITVTETEVTP